MRIGALVGVRSLSNADKGWCRMRFFGIYLGPAYRKDGKPHPWDPQVKVRVKKGRAPELVRKRALHRAWWTFHGPIWSYE